MFSTLLIDDEPAANSRMRTLLSSYPEFKILGAVQSIAEAKEFLKTTTPGVIFLDMEMRGGSGLSILRLLKPATRVVFVTAYPDYAVAAFEAGAVDYLVKPVDPERLEKTIERIRVLKHPLWIEPLNEEEGPSDAKLDLAEGILHLASRRYGKAEHLPIATIVWIQAAMNYTEVQFFDTQKPVVYRRRLIEWKGVLGSERFQLLDRSLIIQYALLRSTEWIHRDQTLLRFEGLEEPLIIGRAASARLKKILNQESDKNTV